MQLANKEAMRLGHQYIGREHILLGILAQRDSVAEACERAAYQALLEQLSTAAHNEGLELSEQP